MTAELLPEWKICHFFGSLLLLGSEKIGRWSHVDHMCFMVSIQKLKSYQKSVNVMIWFVQFINLLHAYTSRSLVDLIRIFAIQFWIKSNVIHSFIVPPSRIRVHKPPIFSIILPVFFVVVCFKATRASSNL